jgi:glycosyltransferase involved in cell wall biosynthesis
VLQLSTSNHGGAGISAAILDKKLQEYGVESRLITRSNLKLYEIANSKATTFLGKITASNEYDFLSSHSAFTLDPKQVSDLDPHIIHVHNWYNMLSVSSFSILSKISPIVFTLHDERLVTGGCHVTLGCGKYLSKCTNCPAHRLHFSREKYRSELVSFFESGANYGIISPSNWLMKKIERTPMAKNAMFLRVIPNHLAMHATTLSTPKKNVEKTQLIFVASNLEAPYKGLKLLFSAMSILDTKLEQSDKKLDLTLVGSSTREISLAFKNICMTVKPQLSTEELSEQLTLTDILVVPSLSENYPGVVAEAQLQGARVVANNIGGISEMVDDGFSGYLSSPNPESLAEKIFEAIFDPNWEIVRTRAFQAVNARQNEQLINQRHKEAYEELLNGAGE